MHRRRRPSLSPPVAVVVAVALAVGVGACSPSRPPPASPGTIVERMQREADAVSPLLRGMWAKSFVGAARTLPPIVPRILYQDQGEREQRRYFTAAEAAALPPGERKRLDLLVADEALYYDVRWGTPISYARPLDLIDDGKPLTGRRILDFGFGTIGQLRLLATLGNDVTGVDTDPLLVKLFGGPGDQGDIGGGGGKLHVIIGRFPGDAWVREAVGQGYDLIISKNVLKRGYIHPERPAPAKRLIKLGVSDEEFLRVVFSILKPGGRMLIYNLAPAPAPLTAPYIPWADGRSPFTVAQWEAAGFRVVVFDRDDGDVAREVGHRFGYDVGPEKVDLAKDWFATWTLVERPEKP